MAQRARCRGNHHVFAPADPVLVGLTTLQHWLWRRLKAPGRSRWRGRREHAHNVGDVMRPLTARRTGGPDEEVHNGRDYRRVRLQRPRQPAGKTGRRRTAVHRWCA
ncbi:MAG: FUSC family protein [Desulfobacterales bacterium]|nr:FUSC family protein [Desulfobacterales bacterium]